MIEHTEIGGERPLFGSKGISLNDVKILDGESALKCSAYIQAQDCIVEGRYVFWECSKVTCRSTRFEPSARACCWYGKDHEYSDCRVDGPKFFREIDGLKVERTEISSGAETFWRCSNASLRYVRLTGAEYCFMGSVNFLLENVNMQGKYTFQYARNFEIHNSKLDTKDAFWESEDCTVYDSEIKGEYLGWYSRNLKLVRCHISGTQPLCYCKNLVLEDCVFDASCDRCFEKSTLSGSIIGKVTSIEEPVFGTIEYR